MCLLPCFINIDVLVMRYFTTVYLLVGLVTSSQPAQEDIQTAIENHVATLRKRHPTWNEGKLRDVATEHLYSTLPETRFEMPEYPKRDYWRMTPVEIVRLSYQENPSGKNADLVPRIAGRLLKGNHQVDEKWIIKQLSLIRREAKDTRWEEYQRFIRS